MIKLRSGVAVLTDSIGAMVFVSLVADSYRDTSETEAKISKANHNMIKNKRDLLLREAQQEIRCRIRTMEQEKSRPLGKPRKKIPKL